MNILRRCTRWLTLRRVAGHLWLAENKFDLENNEPSEYYRVYLIDEKNKLYANIFAVHGVYLEINLYDGNKFDLKKRVNSQTMTDYSLGIWRKYHKISVEYSSEIEFLCKDWWHPFVFRIKEQVLQSRYQLMTPIRAERLDVLKVVLDNRLSDNGYAYMFTDDTISSRQIMVKLFGPRVLKHAEGGRISSRAFSIYSGSYPAAVK